MKQLIPWQVRLRLRARHSPGRQTAVGEDVAREAGVWQQHCAKGVSQSTGTKSGRKDWPWAHDVHRHRCGTSRVS